MQRQSLPNLGEGEEYDLHARAEPTYNVNDAREARIVAWRADCLERVGFGLGDAMQIALRRDIDRERAEALILAGASSDVATRILL